MTRWEHLTEVPDAVRTTMATAFAAWERQDLGVESHLEGTYRDQHVIQATCRTLRASANAIRVPALCKLIASAHPSLCQREIFAAVALFLGLHEKSIQRYFYAEHQGQAQGPIRDRAGRFIRREDACSR